MTAMTGVGLTADKVGSQLKTFALVGVALAATALTDMVVQSVGMAGEFQASMTRLTTTAGESTKNLAMVSAGILKISVDTGTGAQEIAKSMYTIESGGFHGADGLRVMTVAAQAARMEQANLTDVSRALVTVMTDYHMPASQAANATNELVTAVSLGRANLEDMSKAMASVLPIAAASGVSFAQVGAAVAVMTNAGNSAQISTKWLANAITALSAPNAVAVKSMKSVGLTAQELSDTLRHKGLGPAIQEVTDAVGKKFPAGSVEAVTALKKIMGGVTGYKVALELGGASMKTYIDNVNKIAASAKIGGTTIQGWSDVQGNFNFKMDQAKAAANAFMITLGSELLPVFGKIIDQITPIITGFITWESKTHTIQNAVKGLVDALVGMVQGGANVVNFFKNNELAMDGLKSVLIAFALVVTPLVVMALQALAVSAWAAIVPILPFVAAIAVLSLAIFGLVELIKNWGAIQDWLTGKTKQSQLQQQELNQKNALKTIQISEQQKRGVLANMEDERTQLIAKIKGMADGADKSREQIRLSALNAQINTTKGDLKELDNEKAQHLKILKDLQSQDPQIREQTKVASIQKQIDTKNGVLKHLDEEKAQLIAKITNEKDGSNKQRDLMKLDAINKQLDTTKGAIKALDSEKTQHSQKLKDMISSDLEARKSWQTRAGDSLQAWGDDQLRKLDTMIKGWSAGLSRWGNDNANHLNQVIQGWSNNLQTLGNTITSWCGQTFGGWMSWLGSLVRGTADKLGQIPGIVSNALASAASAAFSGGLNVVQGIANGIMSGIGAVSNAIGNVVATIAAHLPHSPAKVGPLSKLHEFGPALVNTFAQDIESSSPRARAAAEHLASGVVLALKNTRIEIKFARAHHEKALVTQLEAERKQLVADLRSMKAAIHEDNFTWSNANPNQPINFNGAHHHKGIPRHTTGSGTSTAMAGQLALNTSSEAALAHVLGSVNGTLGRVHVSLAQLVSVLSKPIQFVPAPGVSSFSATNGTIQRQPAQGAPQPIILQVDGQTFARLLIPYTVDQIRNNVGIHF